ncbi:hypothetical protein F4802DRAFT_600747 [Xylaria palmicola]|nr:hypothetical protein F4802DRAFT_600747 [Xylaria palmicola]
MSSPTNPVHLRATYTSPSTSTPQVFSSVPLPLPSASSPATTSTEQKTAYLHALRAATIDLQDRVNAALTARMEEDAAAASAKDKDGDGLARGEGKGKGKGGKAGKSVGGGGVDEAAEEENYGEEVPDEDDE